MAQHSTIYGEDQMTLNAACLCLVPTATSINVDHNSQLLHLLGWP